MGRQNSFIKEKYRYEDLSNLGEIIYCADELIIIKLSKPKPFLHYIALKVRELDQSYLYYNSQGAVSSIMAVKNLVDQHALIPESKFEMTLVEKAAYYKQPPTPPKPVCVPTKKFRWPSETLKRLKTVKSKMRERLSKIYKERKEDLVKRGIPDWDINDHGL